MQNNLLCPNCKTQFRADTVKKIHPDVFDELVYSDCSVETNNFLAEVFDYQKEKRITMLNIIKTLDKENTRLKETNKSTHENIQICEVFLKNFQKDKKDLQEKCKILEFKNSTLLTELGKLKYDEKVTNVFEASQLKCGNIIEKIFSNDNLSSKESLVNEGLFSL